MENNILDHPNYHKHIKEKKGKILKLKMKKENETTFKEPDYKAIQKLSHRMDCVLYVGDFNTYYPSEWTDRTMSSINRYLIYSGKDELI